MFPGNASYEEGKKQRAAEETRGSCIVNRSHVASLSATGSQEATPSLVRHVHSTGYTEYTCAPFALTWAFRCFTRARNNTHRTIVLHRYYLYPVVTERYSVTRRSFKGFRVFRGLLMFLVKNCYWKRLVCFWMHKFDILWSLKVCFRRWKLWSGVESFWSKCLWISFLGFKFIEFLLWSLKM